MSTTIERRDWTPMDKRHFEDVAIEFIKSHMWLPWNKAKDAFNDWIYHQDASLYPYRNLVWSYVIVNWVD